MVGRIFKGALLVAGAAIAVLAVALVAAWFEHDNALTLPAPTGAYGVGRNIEVWADRQRQDSLVDSPADFTELVVWTWFPSPKTEGQPVVEYVPAEWRQALALREGLPSRWLTRDPAAIRPHSTQGAHLAPDSPTYPLVILRAGADALSAEYTALAEELASHGYIVVAFDAPYRTRVVVFPDGRVVSRPPQFDPGTVSGTTQQRLLGRLLNAWTGDVGFVIDRLRQIHTSDSGPFSGRLELMNIAIVGHALGGATAAQFCQSDLRCAAGVNLDGALYGRVAQEGLQRPFMFLLSDRGEAPDAAGRQFLATIRSVHGRLGLDRRAAFVLHGADHVSFSDSLLARSRISRGVMWLLGNYDLEPRAGLALAGEAVRRFLDVHLKAAPLSVIREFPAAYPEVVVPLR